MRPFLRCVCCCVLTVLSICPLVASAAEETAAKPKPAIELGAPFTDNAILQRQMKAPVWGWSTPATKVTVAFAGQNKIRAAGKDGKWMVWLDPLKASATPRRMVIADNAGRQQEQRWVGADQADC